jgi:hypothetical protein
MTQQTADPKRSMERLEEAITDLLYQVEHWTHTGWTMHDMKVRRRYLLEAARKYGRAMDALARKR